MASSSAWASAAWALGQQLIAAVGCTDSNRMLKGETLARLDRIQILPHALTHNALEITGKVQGTPVTVKLPQVHKFTPQYTPRLAIAAMTRAQLDVAHSVFESLSGPQMYALSSACPVQVAETLQVLDDLGVHVVPRKLAGLVQFECDCPEYRTRGLGHLASPEPCKHGMALFYKLARDIDLNPLEVFRLRSCPLPTPKASPSKKPRGETKQDGDSESQPVDIYDSE